jgi:methane monooxygenase PmoA-like
MAPVEIVSKLDRLIIAIDGAHFATYTFLGARRPYFWPVVGPAGGSVVRGQGTGEHPHHTGLGIAYGGHGEGGSTNIWSDWDEPPYGPCGRMLHRGFRVVRGGREDGLFVEEITYLSDRGDVICDEVRTVRVWAEGADARFIDIVSSVRDMTDAGPRPFILAARTAWDPRPESAKPAWITNSAGVRVPQDAKVYQAEWCDISSEGAEARHGIAVFDHPSNPGFPGTFGKTAVLSQITLTHYPPAGSDEIELHRRIYVHAGDADAGRVSERAAEYRSEGPKG